MIRQSVNVKLHHMWKGCRWFLNSGEGSRMTANKGIENAGKKKKRKPRHTGPKHDCATHTRDISFLLKFKKKKIKKFSVFFFFPKTLFPISAFVLYSTNACNTKTEPKIATRLAFFVTQQSQGVLTFHQIDPIHPFSHFFPFSRGELTFKTSEIGQASHGVVEPCYVHL